MTCVIDGEFASQMSVQDSPEWLPQIIASHQLVLSKQDRISDSQKQQVIEYISKMTDAVWVSADDFINMSVLFAKKFDNFSQKFAQKQFLCQAVKTGTTACRLA